MAIRPVNGQVAVIPLDADERTPGGIIIPNQAKGAIQRGRVIAVGPGEWQVHKRCKPMVHKDDVIIWREKARNGAPVGNTISVGGEDVILIDEFDVLAILEDDVEQ
jgi:chaperonin GroES